MIEPGQIIKGYELVEHINSGGFGAVYRATQASIGREVAVKFILPGYANNPDFIRRFESEAHLIARLEHPHITPLYDFWRDPSGAYLVMRHLRSGSVRDALAEGPFELTAVSQLLDQVASALDFAHRHNVVHRDIKPGNILLDEDGNAYLADFGIAKVLSGITGQHTAADAVVGSLDYISPEQARSEPVTSRTDVYSLGVTLYELITGEHPFKNASSVERLYKHINDPLPIMDNLPDRVRDNINHIIQKATAKNPEARYPDALALTVAFREGLGLAMEEDLKVVEQLTLREQEILSLIADGLTNRQIADKLVVTVGTVKWHIKQLYKKLGVRSRVQAIVRARELNLIVSGETADLHPDLAPVPSAISLPEPENPYKGLHAFQITDARDFFGRDALTQKLIAHMRESHPLHRFLAIVGPSGSGKSSLVKAGLIPALWTGAIPGSEKWFVVDMLPGTHPLDKLEIALLRVAAQQTGNLREQLQRDARGLLRVADLILPNDDSELVIIIDQFEELFTLVADEAARQHFLNLLHAAISDARSRVRVVVTLRADYYDRPLHYPEFGELVRARMETVLPLSATGLERAVRGPAERVGVTFEQGLAEQIVSDMHYQAGPLPLLQYALTELFDRRNGRLLTHESYHQIGGAVGALANRADEIYRSLPENAQALAQQMFMRLVTLGEGAEDTRRRAAQAELLSLTDDDDLMEEIIDQFAAYRLLSLDHDPESRQPTVEVAHEAILREWERLRQWLNDSRDDIRQSRALSHAAEAWAQHDREESFLLRGARLEQVEKWMATSALVQTPLEQAFISQSLAQREKEAQAEKARRARESELERRSQVFLRGLVTVFALATVISAGLALFALNQRRAALDSAADVQNVALIAGSQAALANDDTDTAVALAWQAVALNPDSALAQAQLSEVAYALGTVRILEGNEDIVNRIVLSPDDKTLLGGVDDGSVILWDTETGEIVWQKRVDIQRDPPWVQDVAFSPDGQFVAATYDDRIIFWYAADGRLFRQIDSLVNRQKIAFSPAGEQFATIGSEESSRLVLWDFATGEIVGEYTRGSNIEDIAYTADGSAILLAGKAGEITMVDAQTGQLLKAFEAYSGSSSVWIRNISLSPDGAQVIAAAVEAGLLVWDVSTGELLHNYIYDGVLAAAFHPHDGTALIGDFPLLRTIDLRTGSIVRTTSGHDRGILNVAITSDGSRAFTTSADQTIRMWDLSSGQVVRQYATSSASVGEVDLSPDGRSVLAGFRDGTAALWDVASGEEMHRWVADQPINAVAFSPDGRQVLVGTGYENAEEIVSGHIVLWDVASGTEIRRFEGQPYAVTAVAFSPDGSLAVSAGNGAMAILWEVATGAELRRFEEYWVDSPWGIEAYLDVEFSPDGKQILAAHDDGNIIIWEVASGQEAQQLVGHQEGALGIAFSDDGLQLVSGGLDSQVILWNVQTGSIQQRFTQAGVMTQPRFLPGKSLLLGGNLSGVTSLLQLESGEVSRRYLGHAESLEFSPDGAYVVIGTLSGTVELWRIDASLDELLTWVQHNRYIPELTCEERDRYRITPLCDEALK